MHLNLPLWSYSLPTDWRSSNNSNPLSTLFAAVAAVKPIAATIDIALYLHNSMSHHEHSYSKYVLAAFSSLFIFLYNYDRSCVFRNNTVSTAADCFTVVILQAMELAVPQI